MENLTHTKALLIDIIGSVFNNQNDFVQNLNSHKDNKNNNLPPSSPTTMAEEPSNNNLFVLTILTDRFKVFLNYSFHDEFEKLFNDVDVNGNSDGVEDEFFSLIKNIFNRGKINRSDDEDVLKIRKYVRDSCDACGNSHRAHISYCEEKVKRAQQSSPSDGNIKSMCEEIFRDSNKRQQTLTDVDRTRTSLAIQHHVHPLFGEFFSLFDFITSATMMPSSSTEYANEKYDFIVLDLQIVTNDTSSAKFSWRPLLMLHQNQINQQIFTTHAVMPAYNDWFYHGTSIFWTCGLQCWIITTLALILFLISMVVSIAVGIAVR